MSEDARVSALAEEVSLRAKLRQAGNVPKSIEPESFTVADAAAKGDDDHSSTSSFCVFRGAQQTASYDALGD